MGSPLPTIDDLKTKLATAAQALGGYGKLSIESIGKYYGNDDIPNKGYVGDTLRFGDSSIGSTQVHTSETPLPLSDILINISNSLKDNRPIVPNERIKTSIEFFEVRLFQGNITTGI